MIVHIPLGFKDDLEDMDQCDTLFIAALTLFHNIYGTNALMEITTSDIRSMLWNKIENNTRNLQSLSLLDELKQKGWIQSGAGIDAQSVMVQIANSKFNGFTGKFGGCALMYKDTSIAVELHDIRAIMKFCYLLGRLATLTATANVYEIRQTIVVPRPPKINDKHKNVWIIPTVYLDQLTYDARAPKKNKKMQNEQSI